VHTTCGKGFPQEGYMKIHEEIHSDVKKHECTFCGKSFALLYYLTRHLARHEQTKTIGCDQCSKMFASSKAWQILQMYKQLTSCFST
jgi:KRAB domain-containing zinc finger protein